MDIICSPSFQFSKTVAQIPKLFTSSGSGTSERVHWARSDLLAAFHWALLVWITFWPPPTGNWLTAMVVALSLTSGIYLAVLWLRLFREAEEKWSDYGRFATAILLSLIVVAIGRTLPAFVDIATWIQQVVLALCRLHVDFRREDWIQLAAAVAMGAIALFYKFRTETSADCVTKK